MQSVCDCTKDVGGSRETHAAVLATCPIKPGPEEPWVCGAAACAWGAAGGAAPAGLDGYAAVVAGRVCWAEGEGLLGAETVGRDGALPLPDLPWRGMINRS